MTYSIFDMLTYFLTAFIAVLALVPPMRRLAYTSGFVDAPGGRKQHDMDVPPIGGLVIFPVFLFISVLTMKFSFFWPLYAGLILLLAAGAIDDRWHIQANIKFIIQILVAAILVLSGSARLYQLGNLFGFGDVGLTFLSIPLSMLAIVLLVNAVNLIDGLDGLAGGYSAVALFWFMFAAAMAGHRADLAAMAPLMGGLFGFLVYNMRHPLRSRASIFLGDAGSLALGLTLAWFAIHLAQQRAQVLAPISIAWILAFPIIDTGAQFYRRIREGRHPFSPDRGHFHHHLIHAGFPAEEATLFILGISFILGAIGYLGTALGMPQCVMTIGWIFLMIFHVMLSQNSDVYIRIFRKLARLPADITRVDN